MSHSAQSAGATLRAAWLGAADYAETLVLQRRLARDVSAGSGPETVLLLEHSHVYTLGRRGRRSDVLAGQDELRSLGVEVHETDRGGEVTYHGPGQLVCYPIVDLRPIGGPLRFVCALQAAAVEVLGGYGIDASCEGRPTGIWVGDAKIGAIGLHVSRGVSTHGLALNVDPDLAHFDRIVPCGMPGVRVTSMAREGMDAGVRDVARALGTALARALGRPVRWTGACDLREYGGKHP